MQDHFGPTKDNNLRQAFHGRKISQVGKATPCKRQI